MNPTPDEVRIRRALDEIETPMYDIAGAVKEQRARRRRKLPLRSSRPLISAVAAAFLLTITAAAVVQISGGWQALFGRHVVVPEHLTIPLQQEQTIDGYTLTLDDAIVTETGVAVMSSLRRADGEALSARISFENSDLMTDERRISRSCRSRSVFSEDSPDVQYLYYEFDTPRDPDGRELTLQLGPIVCCETSETVKAGLDLAAICRVHAVPDPSGGQPVFAEDYPAVPLEAVGLPSAAEKPASAFAGAALTDDGLYLMLRTPYRPPEGSVTAEIAPLWDTRTETAVTGSSSGCYRLSHSDDNLFFEYFPGLTGDDLPYLQMQFVYQQSIPLTAEPWNFTFRAKSAESRVCRPGAALGDGVRIDKLTISPLGIQIEGTRPPSSNGEAAFSFSDEPEISVLLDDGAVIRTTADGCSITTIAGGAIEYFDISYAYRSGQQSRQFLDITAVASVTIDDMPIPIEE